MCSLAKARQRLTVRRFCTRVLLIFEGELVCCIVTFICLSVKFLVKSGSYVFFETPFLCRQSPIVNYNYTYMFTILHNIDPLFFSLFLIPNSPGLRINTLLTLHCFPWTSRGWCLLDLSIMYSKIIFGTTSTAHRSVNWVNQSACCAWPTRIYHTRTFKGNLYKWI